MNAELPIGDDHADLARRVFGNDVVAETILSFITDDPMHNLGLRLVSPAFNKAILLMVREEYRTIYIRKPREFDDNYSKFKMNKKTVLVKDFLRHLNFLRETANVTVEKVKIERMWPFGSFQILYLIHRFLFATLINGNKQLKSLVGIREICPDGCRDCKVAMTYSKEYGPVQLPVLDEFRGVFETMHVDDFVLNKIAFVSARSAARVGAGQGGCFTIIGDMVSTKFRCKQLVIHLTADPAYHRYHEIPANGHTTYRRVPQPLPREVIDMMIELWHVQKLKFVFVERYDYRATTNPQEWSTHGLITEMRLDQSDRHVNEWKKKLKEVEVVGRQRVVQPTGELRNEQDETYLHLMSVVRKAFPTNLRTLQLHFNPRTVPFVLQSALKGLAADQKYSAITIQLFPEHDDVTDVSPENVFSGILADGHLTINLKRWRLHDPTPIRRRLVEDVLLNGVQFRIRDDAGNRIDLEIFEKSPWK